MEAAFGEINDPLDKLERLQRLHAQSIAYADAGLTETVKKVSEIDKDIGNYKNFITETHGLIDSEMTARANDVRNAMEIAFNVMARMSRIWIAVSAKQRELYFNSGVRTEYFNSGWGASARYCPGHCVGSAGLSRDSDLPARRPLSSDPHREV